ncbi:sugar ABC transporter substrate-binding protein [Tuanshanicoccus lijuaniae]|uniref:sugar ABC transporter substrate-binding protein n=1 Tax=Aerococcaceae bacterium zg-1292 TaxID=2774330 RepID=UPI001934F504|nr:sugar ABC transporter substrate-binding protein [Aerococcaceae bacterium zg-1292]QQA37855.1 sugar ABC transporter substrate-binding protein [Aerococcaceae bacterium zg-1292]
MFKLKKLVTGIMTGALLLGASVTTAVEVFAAESKTLYFIPVVDIGAYWNPMRKGAEDTAKRLGYELVVKTSPPAEAQKNEKHIGFINEAVSNKAAGIAIAPIEANMFKNPIKDAMDAKIPVVTFDGDLENKEDRTSYVGTNNVEAGHELGVRAATALKEKGITSGSLAIVTVDRAMPTMIDREKGLRAGFEEVMGEDAKNFKFLETIQDNDQAAVSKQQLEGQITANQDLKLVFSLGSEGPDVGVMEALSAQNKAGEIMHFGFDYTPTWEKGIEDGRITGIVDQDAYTIGVKVIENLVKAIEGEEIESTIPIPVKFVPAEEIVEYGKAKSELSTTTTE